MLRISTAPHADNSSLLKIEGVIDAEGVEALDDICRRQLSSSSRLLLDLASVTYADDVALTCLLRLRRAGVEFQSISPFLRELLQRPKP